MQTLRRSDAEQDGNVGQDLNKALVEYPGLLGAAHESGPIGFEDRAGTSPPARGSVGNSRNRFAGHGDEVATRSTFGTADSILDSLVNRRCKLADGACHLLGHKVLQIRLHHAEIRSRIVLALILRERRLRRDCVA